MAKTESTSDSSSSLLNSNTNLIHNHNNQHNHNHTYIRHHRPSCDKSAGGGVNAHFHTGVGTVTRASGNKLTRNHHHPQHQHSSNSVHHPNSSAIHNHNHNHRQQHVAIATQVISPSAIGGSLKIGNRRFCKHYDHEQDDEDEDEHGIFSRRKRVPWGKLTCYGISIGIILLILTGVVLGVGFMQAEKQKILTVKSQKLSLSQEPQKRNYNINVTLDSEEEEDDDEMEDSDESESNHPFMRATTWRPPTNNNNTTNKNMTTNISSSEVVTTSPTPTEESLQSPISKKNDDDTVENSEKETQIPKEFLNEKHDSNNNNKNSYHNEEDSDEEDDADSSSSEEELEIYEPSLSQSPPHNNKNGESRKSEQTAQINARNDNVFLLFGNPDTNTNTNPNPNTLVQQFNLKLNGDVNNEALPSEVKVLPPQGFSFEFPILNNHNSTTEQQEKETTTNSVNSDNSDSNNITFPSFSFTNSINPTPSSSLFAFSPSSSSVLVLPQTPANNDFPLIDLNFTFNPHASVLNYTEQQKQLQQQQHIDSIHNPFDFNPSKNILDDDMLKNGEILQTENSFNTQSPYNNKDKSIQFQTEIFSADEEVGAGKDKTSIFGSSSGIGKNSRSDTTTSNNNDVDSEMSASNKMRGRNPPKMTPADNTYTPRPGSNPNRPGRPLFSTKTKSLYSNNNNHHQNQNHNNNNNRNQNHNNNNQNQNNNHNNKNNQHDYKNSDGMTLVHFYSDRSEVKVPAPSSMTTPKPDNNLQFNFAQFTSTSPPSSSQSSTKDENKGDGSSSKNDVNLNLYNFNSVKSNGVENPSSSSSSSTNFDLTKYQIVTPSTNTPTSEFHFDFSTLTTPSPQTGATTSNFNVNLNLPSSSSTNNNPDVLSKRTYNFDFDTAGSGQTSNYNNPYGSYGSNYSPPSQTFNPSGSNPFAHLLGPNAAVTGAIGQTSATGANLGYNFQDFNSGFNNNNNNYGGTSSSSHSIPTGTIPLDLASSYIQVGFPGIGKSQNNGYGGNGDSYGSSASNTFDYTSAYANANPTLGIATILQNGGGGGGGGSSGYLGGNGGFSSGLQNKQPDYNTITQGIHLLSLLSGSIPHHLLDTQPSASNTEPQFQIAALTGLGGSSPQFLHGLHSSISSDSNSNSNGYSSNSHQLSPYIPAESRSLHTSSSDLHSSKSLPPPDQQTSFSQNIVTKLGEFSNIYKKSVGSTDPNPNVKGGDSLTSETANIPSSISLSEPLIRELEKSKENNNNMFQLKIDENSNLKSILEGERGGGGTNREIDKISDIPSALTTAIDVKDISKSTASSSASSSSSLPDMETSASEVRHISSVPSSKTHLLKHTTNLIPSEKPRINFSKKLLIKTNKRINENLSTASEMRQEKGLKSGFYI